MYFEDYEVGMVFDDEIESISFTEEEIIEAAKIFDPRPIHIDKEAAKASQFGKIIGSGSWANAIFWNQWVKTGIDQDGLIVGIGVEKSRWLKPVIADTTYDIKVEITDKKIRREDKDGFVTYKLTAYDPDGNEVLFYEATGLVKFKSNE